MSLSVVLATHNQHKVDEFQRILSRNVPGITVVAYDGPEPVEDGTTFAENALIKARVAAEHTGLVALADDSGIGVDVMGGAPGIFSARWAGPGRDSDDNLQLLLAQLSDIQPPNRQASFHCTIAVVVPASADRAGSEHLAIGEWRGELALAPRGDNGFGYDPVFVPEGLDRTAAELESLEKNEISHRARAFRDLIPVLDQIARGI